LEASRGDTPIPPVTARPNGSGGGYYGKAIHWPGEAIARGAEAVGDAHSNDTIVLARACLEAAVRGADDVEALLNEHKPRPQGKPKQNGVQAEAVA
jgi:hypothetical protein